LIRRGDMHIHIHGIVESDDGKQIEITLSGDTIGYDDVPGSTPEEVAQAYKKTKKELEKED